LHLLHTIDTQRFSEHLRRQGIDLENESVLVSHFEKADEAKDFTIPPNCEGFGRIHHFRRVQPAPWPENPLPIDPATRALGLDRVNELPVQVFQNAICSWRCWYCFVDFDLLSANPRFSKFKKADELIDLYLAEGNRPPIIDLSGGQPDLVPEWGFWFAKELKRRQMEKSVYLWTDDNLSNDFLWRCLTSGQIQEMARLPAYGRVGCFKGFDPESFAFNTKADPKLFSQQFKLMHRLVSAGFDVFGYVTLTTPNETDIAAKVSTFIDRLQEEVHPLFPLRTVPLRIEVFTPTKSRVGQEQLVALRIQESAVEAWNSELRRRFTIAQMSKNITEHSLDNK
jgi:uncharacterized Fe-S cluster-containing radical SAM superfamily protein